MVGWLGNGLTPVGHMKDRQVVDNGWATYCLGNVDNAWANSWLGNLLTMVGQKMVGTIGNSAWAAGQFADADLADYGWAGS